MSKIVIFVASLCSLLLSHKSFAVIEDIRQLIAILDTEIINLENKNQDEGKERDKILKQKKVLRELLFREQNFILTSGVVEFTDSSKERPRSNATTKAPAFTQLLQEIDGIKNPERSKSPREEETIYSLMPSFSEDAPALNPSQENLVPPTSFDFIQNSHYSMVEGTSDCSKIAVSEAEGIDSKFPKNSSEGMESGVGTHFPGEFELEKPCTPTKQTQMWVNLTETEIDAFKEAILEWGHIPELRIRFENSLKFKKKELDRFQRMANIQKFKNEELTVLDGFFTELQQEILRKEQFKKLNKAYSHVSGLIRKIETIQNGLHTIFTAENQIKQQKIRDSLDELISSAERKIQKIKGIKNIEELWQELK